MRVIPFAALVLVLAGCASAPRVDLVRVAGAEPPPDLQALYRDRGVPLLVIGSAVYAPPCACMDDPCGRNFGGVSEKRQVGGEGEKRDVGAAGENRQAGGVAENRQGGGAGEKRDVGAAGENRQTGAVGEARQEGNAAENRENGGAAEKREAAGASEQRMLEASAEKREVGGVTSGLRCQKVGSGRFKIITVSDPKIRVFDASGLYELGPDKVVQY
jgi:hypothetical protein